MSSLDDEITISVPDAEIAQMSDGIGLSLNEVKALIAKKHKTVIAHGILIL